MISSPPRTETVSVDQTADRVALVRKVALVHKVRRLADEVETLSRGLDQAGALAEIRRYSQIHYEQIPPLDLLQIAGVLRCYAGTLSLLASTAPKPQESHFLLRISPKIRLR